MLNVRYWHNIFKEIHTSRLLNYFSFQQNLFISTVFVCMLSTFWVMSPATIHKEFKMLDIISIDYNPLMTILRIAKTKS